MVGASPPDGTLLATIFEQPYTDAQTSLSWMYGYDGKSLLVARHGGLAQVSNTGTIMGEVWSPGDNRCDPVRWWDADTFLAVCYGQTAATAPLDESGNVHNHYGVLWLLETNGSPGVALTSYPAETTVGDFGYRDAWPAEDKAFLQWKGDCGASQVAILQPDGTGVFAPISVPPSMIAGGVKMIDIVGEEMSIYGWQDCDGSVGALFTTDLNGGYLHDLVPIVGDARSVLGAQGLATVYP